MRPMIAFLAGAALSLGATAAQAETVWNLATAYKDSNYHTQNIARFVEEIEQKTGGKLKIKLHTNASLLKMPEIKRGVQTGQVQIGEILLSAYGKEDPFFEVDGIPFLTSGQKTVWEVYELSLPHIEAKLAKQGLMPLFSVPWPGQGLYAKKPTDSIADYKGVKFRAYNALTARFAELIGAVPTTVQSAEVPQAFATGVVSAMITSSATGNYTKAWDFTSHYYDINAISNKNMVIMNAKAFNALDADIQKVVMRAAAKAETRGWVKSNAVQASLTENLAKNGMTVAPPSEQLLKELKGIGKTMIDEWLAKAGPRGQEFIEKYNAIMAKAD
ncbi:MAG: TRAP transporter substrate-binding protein [Hyphomicrobiales bacterium]|nr:TRAP transporter substrate-binding protein [Hyphomicrobiales bacterium]